MRNMMICIRTGLALGFRGTVSTHHLHPRGLADVRSAEDRPSHHAWDRYQADPMLVLSHYKGVAKVRLTRSSD